jgi:hypothetical protein
MKLQKTIYSGPEHQIEAFGLFAYEIVLKSSQKIILQW